MNVSRRTLLRLSATTGGVAGYGYLALSPVAAQETIEFAGWTDQGWVGRSPASIEDESNPTLELTPGETYEVVWENMDGNLHNFAIIDADSNHLVQTETMARTNETQTVTFEATEDMAEYLCDVHPNSMRGDVEIVGGDQETTTEQAETTPFTVQVTTHPEHGVILTDVEGMTLYRFTEDEEGESTCYDDCAEAWPPLTVEELPTIPDGLPGEFTTAERDDGSIQVTYNGMPLYYFAKDEEPGDTNGQGVSDAWFVVNPACPDENEMVSETTTEGG